MLPRLRSYEVSFETITGYHPVTILRMYDIIGDEYRENITYIKSLTGIYIYDINDNLISPSNWDSSNTAIGVAVLDPSNNRQFLIALEDAYPTEVYFNKDNINLSTVSTSSSNGVANTEALKSYDLPAIQHIIAYTNWNGVPRVPYLGASSEWKLCLDNKAAIVEAMSICGGTPLKDDAYYTSSKLSSTNVINCNWEDEYLNYNAFSRAFIRAFSAL